MSESSSSRRRRRLWRFADAEFDEASWALRVGGRAVALEGKPLEVLHELLLRAGEVVTKDEILDAVWPGVTVVEGSLATAVSKLRKALGTREDNVIETVPRIGYRLTATVRIESIDSPLAPRFNFTPDDAVPGRPQWRLDAALGDTGAADVWLARHAKTGEARVFKFADAPDRLRGLKREATLSRLLFAGLGRDAPIPALLEWNFDASPYFVEYAYGGRDLVAWAADAGGLPAIPLERRLAVATHISRAVEAVHAMGVLHKDLKPANILIDAEDGETVRLVDFGSGRLVDESLLDSFAITRHEGLDAQQGGDDHRSGTLAYRAPELAAGAAPTVRSDVYALGLILYQLVAGDFGASVAPGWEDAIADPLLRDDIAATAEGAPERRLGSAGALAERIETLERRHADAAEAAAQAAFLAEQRQLDERRRTRRPWIYAAATSLVVGLVGTSAFAIYALRQRDEAVAARALAEASYAFVAEDVLASPDPARSAADETVIDAIRRASASIDRHYASTPGVAARLHLSIARAFHQRSDFDFARREYEAADRLFAGAGEADSDEAVVGRLGRIAMESVSGQPERLEEAARLLVQEKTRLGPRGETGRVGFALAQAEGSVGYSTDLAAAESAFRRAIAIAEAPDSTIAAPQLLKMRSSLALTLMRQGRPQEAEPLARAIVADSVRVRGADHPDTLVTRQHLLTSLVMQGKAEEALQGSDALLAAMQARFGPDHRFTLGLRSTRFESFSALGRYPEAAREAERVWRGAAAQAGPQSHQALVGQIDYASALCQTDQRDRAVAIAQDALASVRTAFGPDYPLTHSVRFFVAECLIANRRFVEAGALLDGLDPRKVESITGQSDFDALVALALAEIALGTGNPTRARSLFGGASRALRDAQDPLVRNRLEALARSLGRP